LPPKTKKGGNCKAPHKEEILKNEKWRSLIVLSDKEVTSLNEEDEDKMLIITNKDIQEFKDT